MHIIYMYSTIVYRNYIIEPQSYNLMLKYGITMQAHDIIMSLWYNLVINLEILNYGMIVIYDKYSRDYNNIEL